jgi:hypothetical protein
MEIVPVEFEVLRGSANTVNQGGRGWKCDIVVGYGGPANYAIFVHEIPPPGMLAFGGFGLPKTERASALRATRTARHKEGKTWKFLEKPIRTERVKMLAIVVTTVKTSPVY